MQRRLEEGDLCVSADHPEEIMVVDYIYQEGWGMFFSGGDLHNLHVSVVRHITALDIMRLICLK